MALLPPFSELEDCFAQILIMWLDEAFVDTLPEGLIEVFLRFAVILFGFELPEENVLHALHDSSELNWRQTFSDLFHVYFCIRAS